MTHPDARTLPPAAQAEKRRIAMAMREAGATFSAIGAALGVHYMTVSMWWDRYQRGGPEALAVRRRGPKPGAHRRLTPRQERAIQRAITDTTPDQLKLPFALWTRTAIAQLIQMRFGVALPVRTMGQYLRRWGFTAQKPIKRAYEQRPEAIAQWLKTAYPRIKRRASTEGAEIHWGDETSLSTSDSRGRSFAPKGRTPVRPILSQRRSVSFLSTISNAGTLRFMVLKQAIDAPTLIRFFTRLCREADRKVFVILDNLNVHKARDVRTWLARHAEALEVFYLPSYSPELNPDEYLNGDLKLSVAKRAPARDRAGLLRTATSRLRSLQRRPEKVRKFFQHPRVQYAA
ncbi:MAG TPA: IS630 family transposase [Gemmatimonadaceae bacterium]|nr:IS630 family transposase [Gemmatimonadaceae bacterium]